jgi:YidC/Oxa1 family membrane protein insertase
MIVAVLLAAVILFGWPYLTAALFPEMVAQQQAAERQAAQPASGNAAPGISAAPSSASGVEAPGTTPARTVRAALGGGNRVIVETPRLRGSINLVGARIDDITLTRHRQSLAEGAPPVRLFAPGGTRSAYFAGLGWSGSGAALPGPDTLWTASGSRLTPTTPVTLSWDNGGGQLFEIFLSVDADYMFTARQRVTNRGSGPVAVAPYAYLNRIGLSPDPDTWTIHTGVMGVFNRAADYDMDAETIGDAGTNGITRTTTGGWLGFTDHFWLGAVIPEQNVRVDTAVRAGSGNLYQANFAYPQTVLSPGRSLTRNARIFAGAKEIEVLDRYMDGGITMFDQATDWGWFKWFAKPIYYLLEWLFALVGNFGVAIMLLTLLIRLLMFPIAQRQFASMAQMRIVQPKLKALQDKYKDDKPRLQQAMMELYKTEKINPLAGCLPILIQIPIFYALYKCLMLAVEMRHQPFALWIKDLSAPDPATFLNLFGLLDFTPPALLAVGVLALLLGLTMWVQFKLNPPPPDPIQAQMFSIMPWILMFVMAPFAAGLLLYWITNNILSIGQQRLLYARYPEMKQAMATPAK